MTLRSITLLQNFVFVNNTQCQRWDSNPLNAVTGIFNGASERARTADLFLTKEVLCLLSYRSILAGVGGFEPPNTGVKVLCLTAWRYPKITRH